MRDATLAAARFRGLPEEAAKASIGPGDAPGQSGLLRIARSASHNLDDRFERLLVGFAEALQHEEGGRYGAVLSTALRLRIGLRHQTFSRIE